MTKSTCSFRWIGSDEPHLDDPLVYSQGRVHIGVYGGNTNAGADKNEDGALAWSDESGEWEFAMIIDGHNSSESVRLLVDEIEAHQSEIEGILCNPVSQMFKYLQQYVVNLLASIHTTSVRGESSCLVVARKGCYLTSTDFRNRRVTLEGIERWR
ncbi:hypothetical protein [Alicyclobacillus ferrooxydans]|uniref:hypothetical protein n=1 Tax=Alicyclobacillus ferrooxydans TaxID=471514 RepID=UPI0006D52D6C|nr:hypothetical protein [Alicyclobacillus ferrooxydans]